MAKDFKVISHFRASRPDVEHWAVVSGKTDKILVSPDRAKCDELATNLNRDPWFLDRGYTKKDRCAGF